MANTQITSASHTSNDSVDYDYKGIFSYLLRGDILLALGIVCILVVLILPMPTWLLDLSLAISITLSTLILMTVLFIDKALDFNSFPTVLLITTLLRLSLNLASTRLILAQGHTGHAAAGKVIEAFGDYITGNNYVIGIIIFGILTLVNFVVITKGSGRIAEVAARFSLDAMPGKQMAIDADLSAGLIDEDSARERRTELESESNFFGSMDGAAKFVRGDAIAGLLITFINIIGGMIIGIAQQNLSFSQAAQNYTVLTVGDGLVSQVPALIVSIAAGLLVSKSSGTGSTDKALFGQLGNYPRALGISSVLMCAMSFLPGMPFLPFIILSSLAGSAAWTLHKRKQDKTSDTAKAENIKQNQENMTEEQSISQALSIDTIRLEMGYALLSLVNNEEDKMLTSQIKNIRKQIASEVGFVMPAVRIQDNLQLDSNEYRIYIKEIDSGHGNVKPNFLLAMDPSGKPVDLPGEQTKEPSFGLSATWIEPNLRDEAQFKGYTVVDPQTVIATHLAELIRENMPDLLNYSETQKLLDELPKQYEKLVADIIPTQISLGGFQRILQNLLGENVSIRDLPTIIEGISEAASYSRNINAITENVRVRLARQISDTSTGPEGYIPFITLSPEWEQIFIDSLIGEGDDKQLSLAPSKLQEFIKIVKNKFSTHMAQGVNAILLTSPSTRSYVRSLVERFRPQTIVMSQNEVHSKAKIKTIDQI